MGLSFHYGGRIRSSALVEMLTEEVRDICVSVGWNYIVWPIGNLTDKPADLEGDESSAICPKGISFAPANCEPVFLTFLPDGNLASPLFELSGIEYSDSDYALSTKTQFAGCDAHLALMKLLFYLENKYFAALNVEDEGNYWETKDENILKQHFKRYDEILNNVADAISPMDAIQGESPGSLADRIEDLLNNFNKENKNQQ
jgi:hypothetical protein